ncbi:hypothetical protein STEG23_012003 [Scotinomys teguina]
MNVDDAEHTFLLSALDYDVICCFKLLPLLPCNNGVKPKTVTTRVENEERSEKLRQIEWVTVESDFLSDSDKTGQE